MVTITLIIEGGAPEAQFASFQVFQDYQKLRRAFNLFFQKILPNENISIEVLPSSNYKAAAKIFVKRNTQNTFLYVDLDGPANHIRQWFDEIGENTVNGTPIIFDEDHRQHTYFMIQAMEAWFLKQPECIDRWVAADATVKREHPTEDIANHSTIRGKNIELLEDPDKKLYTLLAKYVRELKGKEWKRLNYKKQKHAANLLEHLDPHQLCTVDAQLQSFAEMLRSIS